MSKDITELIYDELKAFREDMKSFREDIDDRVSGVEHFQERQKGVMAAGGIFVAAISWVLSYFGSKT